MPEAMLNFMVLLGWALDDKTEVMPTDDIIKGFSLEHITKSSAIFDREKLTWMNGVYIRELPADELAARMLPFLGAGPAQRSPAGRHRLSGAIAPLVPERIKLLSDSAEMTRYFFEDLPDYDAKTLCREEWTQSRHGTRCKPRCGNCEIPQTSRTCTWKRCCGRLARSLGSARASSSEL